jgi:hypothetical protein
MQRILRYLFIGASIILSAQLQAQSDVEKYIQQQQKAFNEYAKTEQERFNQYRDSLNRQFAIYLKEAWKSFDLEQQERGFKPMPKPPVYDPNKPDPNEKPQPVPVKPSPPEKPQPTPDKPTPQPLPKPAEYPIKVDFFGKQVGLQTFNASTGRLLSVSENDVSDYWLSLSKLAVNNVSDDIVRIKNELKLNDWGMYLLIGKIFQKHFHGRSENEEVIFSIFMLNQLGYRARIGRANNELVPLIAFQNSIYNTSFFMFGGSGEAAVYYVLNLGRKRLSSVQTCGKEYSSEGKIMNLSIAYSPLLSNEISTKKLVFQKKEYAFNYKQSYLSFYETYPCVDFLVYVKAPLEESFLKSLRTSLLPAVQNKTQEEAVNFLLHFVQNAFVYKSDQEQYDYEKWNFAEETLVYPYSDCDDRSIFFVQLVKNLLKMEVVLLHYPGYHLATAVKFNNQNLQGSYVMVNGVKYLICDPTYINANIGMDMPQLRSIGAEVIEVK